MMTFYAAAGSYQIRNEDGKDMPYIMRLGKLQPVSIPEFSIWSMLLWDVLTHDELRKKYFEKMEEVKLDPSGFEKALEILLPARCRLLSAWLVCSSISFGSTRSSPLRKCAMHSPRCSARSLSAAIVSRHDGRLCI